MRIALCHKRLDEKGGTERDFSLTARGLRDRGHEVHLFCSEFAIDPPAGTFAHRVPVVPLGRTARLWSFARRAPAIIQQFNCDVVVSFGRMIRQDVLRSGGGSHKIFLEKLAKNGGAARAWWQRLSIYHRSLLALEKQQFENSSLKAVIAVSAEVKRELIEAYGVPESKILILYNGVDPVRFHPSLKQKWRTVVRAQFGVPLEADLVLFVGSGFYRKGFDRLLRIWGSPELKDAFLIAVGDDARLRRYRSWAERQAPGRIIFAGRQEHIERFYGAADVLALPALQEAFGNVVLEALASGVPPVVSRSVGAAELLTDLLAEGIVEDADAPGELKHKLVQVLETHRRGDRAAAARRLAEACSWDNHFRKLETCLTNLWQRDNGGTAS
jgi:UDP-glucose:(heptosyl)LPS alpha-1,3-glucosyltransferase